MFAQVHTNTMYEYYSFLARVPFAEVDEWRSLQGLSQAECGTRLRNAEVRSQLLAALQRLPSSRVPDYASIELLHDVLSRNATLQQLADARGCHPAEVVIDTALETDLQALYRKPFANVDTAETLALLQHPRALPTFSGREVACDVWANWIRSE